MNAPVGRTPNIRIVLSVKTFYNTTLFYNAKRVFLSDRRYTAAMSRGWYDANLSESPSRDEAFFEDRIYGSLPSTTFLSFNGLYWRILSRGKL